jgi:tetrahydromethanopterin S-methyltransferase subunit G
VAVMMPREKWTDERLDDLNKKVDDGFTETKAEMREGFARVEGEIKRLDGNLGELRREVSARFDKVDARFDAVDERFEALNRTLIGGLFVLAAALIGSNAL